MKRAALISGTTLLLMFSVLIGQGPTLTRGPYLQSGTSSGVTIRWRTSAATDSRGRYGPAANNLPFVTNDAAITTEHQVTLAGLSFDTGYYYSVGSSTVTLAGGDTNHFFVTPPAAGVGKPTRVWVLGDSGTANANARARSGTRISSSPAHATPTCG